MKCDICGGVLREEDLSCQDCGARYIRICKDCGEGTVAGGIELGGKLAILLICIPLIGELIGYASEILSLG